MHWEWQWVAITKAKEQSNKWDTRADRKQSNIAERCHNPLGDWSCGCLTSGGYNMCQEPNPLVHEPLVQSRWQWHHTVLPITAMGILSLSWWFQVWGTILTVLSHTSCYCWYDRYDQREVQDRKFSRKGRHPAISPSTIVAPAVLPLLPVISWGRIQPVTILINRSFL